MQVAATGRWTDEDAVRHPAGEVHGWRPGQNATVCGLQLSRSRLERFPDVSWFDVQPESGGRADAVQAVCPRCAAAAGRRRKDRGWTRDDPRP
ncbi:MAG: hypothetical protein ACLGIG_02180 [Actinomycetes bacterium]